MFYIEFIFALLKKIANLSVYRNSAIHS